MSRPGYIVSLGPVALHFVFDPIVAGLRERGLDVVHLTDFAKFRAESASILKDADVFVAIGNYPFGRELMAQAPRLRGLVSPFIGTEGFDEAAATELGIVVANGQVPENYLSMSESTIMLMLTSLYSLHWWENQLRESRPHPPQVPGRMLRGRTIGLIGFGQIARGIVARLAGWEVRILTYTPRVRVPLPLEVMRVSLEELLRESDVVCVLAALNAETKNMLDREKLRMMKPDATLINVSRGGIVDEAALAQIAYERPDFRIAFDVFTEEPLPRSSPLRGLPNAILTPHAIGHTQESVASLPAAAIENVACILRGEPPPYLRNPDVIPTWKEKWRKS